VDLDVARVLDTLAGEIATLPRESAPPALVARATAALHDALISAAGRPGDAYWNSLYQAAGALVDAVADREALPGLRAFLDENADLCDDRAELLVG
jgi:hypothetical protein